MRHLGWIAALLVGCGTPQVVIERPVDRHPLTSREALGRVDAALARRLDALVVAAGRESGPFTGAYSRLLSAEVLPGLQAILDEARARVRAGRFAEAGDHYMGFLLASQSALLELNLALVSDWANELGQPRAQLFGQLQAYRESMRPLREAAASGDGARLERVMAEAPWQFEKWAEFIGRWAVALKAGDRLSRSALLVADLALVAVSLATAPPAAGAPVLARAVGGGRGAAVAIDAKALAETVEAIRRLLQVGALDWTVVIAASRLGGGPGTTIPALQRPTAFAMNGAGGPPSDERELKALLDKAPAKQIPAGKAAPKHHIFPQEKPLARVFKLRGIDADQYTLRIPKQLHEAIHSRGAKGGLWNQAWRQFVFSGRGIPTREEIFRFAGELIYQFGLDGYPVAPYR